MTYKDDLLLNFHPFRVSSMFSISIARIHIQIASISRHTYFGQVCVDVTYFCFLSVSSLNTWPLKRKAYWLTDLHVTIDWIWRYMIRLGISINILWTSMRILPCYWFTSFASSILWKFHIWKSRSSITHYDVYLPDIDQWLYFKSHVTSHIRFCISTCLSRWSYLSSSTHLFQIVGYYDHVHWQSIIDTKSKIYNDNDCHRYNHFILIAISSRDC